MTLGGSARIASALTGAAMVLGLSFTATPAALADFGTECGSPTRTLTGDRAATIAVAPGETLLLRDGRFTGGIDALPAGGTLCVASSATVAVPYLNNAAGSVVVAPGASVTLPTIAVTTGFRLENQGTVSVEGLNVNGSATIRNLAGATLDVRGGLAPAAGAFVNAGTMRVRGSFDVNGAASLENQRLLAVDGPLTLDGRFTNSGVAAVQGTTTVNGSGRIANECALVVQGGLSNNGPSTNDGYVLVSQQFTNNGTWRQSLSGALVATDLANDGSVTGFGRYGFEGTTRTQGTFAGDSAAAPIDVEDRTPPAPPQIFDVQSGTVTNVVRDAVATPPADGYPAPRCAGVSRPSADLDVSKTGPATVAPDGDLTYTVTITNHGPSPAQDAVVTDDLPAQLTGVTASDSATVAGGTVTWNLGTLAPGQSVIRTITGTAPAAGTLTNTVRGTTSTPDPDPGNNDGSAPAASVETSVVATVPTNDPPVAEPATYTTPVDQMVLERLEVVDPDAGQELRTSLVSGPAHGRVIVLPSGLFGYLPDEGFTGIDTFDYEVCDNGDPRLCSRATITVEVVPVAADDIVETVVNTPTSVPELANDLGDDVTVTIVSGPSHGGASVQPDGSIRYIPGPDYLGTDVMHYRICATSAPTLCDEAEADVVVRPENRPPQLPDQVLRTVVDRPVDGTLRGTDPDGDGLTYTIVDQPAHGTASVSGAGTRYVPDAGYSGRDTYRVVVCDDGVPVFCSTGLVEVEVAPVAVDDSARTGVGQAVDIDVLANDAGAAGPPVVTSAPEHGRVVWRDGTYVYTPDDGFDGTDRFGYRLCSPEPQPEPEPLCSEATVTIVVDPADDDGPAGGGGDDGSDGGGDGTGDGQDDSAGGILPDTGGPALWLGLLGAALLTGGGWLVRRGRRLPASGPWSDSGEAAAS